MPPDDDGEINQGSGTAIPTPADDMLRQTAAFVEGRTAEYATLWKEAADKLAEGAYSPSDLIGDWFSVWGKGLRDMQTLAQSWWRLGPTQPSGGASSSPSQRTIFNDCDVDFSKEFAEQAPRPLDFVCSDIAYRTDRAVAVPASAVTIDAFVDAEEGKGTVRITIDPVGLRPELLLGFLFEKGDLETPVAAINLTVPPAYSRY